MMRKPWIIFLGAVAALIAFDALVINAQPSGGAAVTPIASDAVQSIPTPASGLLTFRLPPGAVSWGLTVWRRSDQSSGPLQAQGFTGPIVIFTARAGDTYTLYWVSAAGSSSSAVYTLT